MATRQSASMPPQSMTYAPLKRFTIFPRLPVEIRCLIWDAMCVPRTVELIYDKEDPEGFCSRAPYPPALEICKESRNAVIKSYPLCFGSVFFPAKVRFNFTLDTLFIDNEFEDELPHLFSTFRDAEINGLRYLALDEYYIADYALEEDKLSKGLKRTLKSLKSLKEVLLVFNVESLAALTLGCSEGHRVEIYDEFPKELQGIGHDKPPTMEQFQARGITVWEGPCRCVYGWNRCGNWEEFVGSYQSESDDSDYDFMGPRDWPFGLPGRGLDFGMGVGYPFMPDRGSDDDDEDEDEEDEDEEDLHEGDEDDDAESID